MFELIANQELYILIFLAPIILTIFWPALIDVDTIIHKAGILLNFVIILILYYVLRNAFTIVFKDLGLDFFVINGFKLGLKYTESSLEFLNFILPLWPACYFYSIGYLNKSNEGNKARYLFFLNLSFIFTSLLALANDLITMFIFYELLTLSTIPLVGHLYSTHVNQAVKQYIFYLFFGSICLWLPAILCIKIGAGNLNFVEGGLKGLFYSPIETKPIFPFQTETFFFLLILYGITKAAVFPMHRWLPTAMVANYPTSGILHAVLVVSSGIFCMRKVFFEIFGLDFIAKVFYHYYFIQYLPLVGLVYASLIAIFEKSVKTTLAWSTVASLNLAVYISFFIKNDFGYFYFISLNKLVLFFVCGIIYLETKAITLFDFKNTARKYFSAFILFVICSVLYTCLIGTSFKENIIDSIDNPNIRIVMMLSSFLSAVIFLKITYFMIQRNEEETSPSHEPPSKLMYISIIYVFCLICFYL